MTASGSGPLNGIGFGTWAWGNQLVWGYDPARDDAVLEATFRQALASGLNVIDTADSYGTGRLNGRSEQLLGQFAAGLPRLRRSQLKIATKLAPFPWRVGRRGFDQALRSSLHRLNGHLQRVQLHWSTARYAPWQEVQLLDGLADQVQAGVVPELGLSNVGPVRLVWMQQRLAKRSVPISSVQMQYSLLSPGDDLSNRLIHTCRDLGIEVLAYSPLAFGVLSQAPEADSLPGTALRRRLFKQLLPGSVELRTTIQAIARDRGVSMVQVALNWCRAHGTTPIPGLRSPEQARDVAAALTWSLSTEEKDRLDRERAACTRRAPSNPFQSR